MGGGGGIPNEWTRPEEPAFERNNFVISWIKLKK